MGDTTKSVPDDMFLLGTDHGCLTGDCPHGTNKECWEILREYIKELCEAGETLREAFFVYGCHRNDGSVFCERLKHSERPCTCGFESVVG